MIHLFALLLLPLALGEKGCCYDHGNGAMFKPCCHKMNAVHKDGNMMVMESECPVEQRMGGATVFEEGKACDELEWYEDPKEKPIALADTSKSAGFAPPEDCLCVATISKDNISWPAKCATKPGKETHICYVDRTVQKPCEESKISVNSTYKFVFCKAAPIDDKMCCEAMTATCMACKEDMSVEDFCKAAKEKEPNKTVPGCGGDDDDGDDGKMCCEAMTATCLACKKDMSVEDFCQAAAKKDAEKKVPGCEGEGDGKKGCCYDHGNGAMFKPCCHNMNDVHKDGKMMVMKSECPVEQRMGGATVFAEGKACDELEWYETEEKKPEAVEFTYKVSLIMDKTCENMVAKDQANGIYVDGEVVTRKSNVCTTNVLGSSVRFECMGDYIMEHVYIDAYQEEAPETPDCSGELKYSMPLKNGCNGFDWGNVLMTWEDFCMTPKPVDCAAHGKIAQKESEGGGCRACGEKDMAATEKDGSPKYPQCRKRDDGGDGKVCCQAVTASCTACKMGLTVQQVCAGAKQRDQPLDGCDNDGKEGEGEKPKMDLTDPEVLKKLAEKYKIPACANNDAVMKGFGGCAGAKATIGGMSKDPCNFDLSIVDPTQPKNTFFWLPCPKECEKCMDWTAMMVKMAMAKEKEEMEKKKKEEAERETPDFSDPEVVQQLAKKYGVTCVDDDKTMEGFGGCEDAKPTLKLLGAEDPCNYDLSKVSGAPPGTPAESWMWLVCPKLCNKCGMWTAGAVKKMWDAEAQKKEIFVKECTDDAYGELKMSDTTCDRVMGVAKEMGAEDQCEFDLSKVAPGLKTGSSIWLFCPKTCNKCVEWKGFRLRQAQAEQKRKEEEGKDFDCSVQPKGVCKKLTGRCSWSGNKCRDAECKCLGLKDKNANGHECSVFMPKNKYLPKVQWCYVDLHACRGKKEKVEANTGKEGLPEGIGKVNCVDAGFKTKEKQDEEYQKAVDEGRVKDPSKSKMNPKDKLCNQADLLGLVTSKLKPQDQPICFDSAANPNDIAKLCACFTKFTREDAPDCYFFEDVSKTIKDWWDICPSHVVIKAVTYESKRLCNQGGIQNAISRTEWHGSRMDGECMPRDDDPDFRGLYGPSKMTCGGDGKIYWKSWDKAQGLKKNEGDEMLCPTDESVKPAFSALVGNGDCIGREVMDRGELVERWTRYELDEQAINQICKDKGPASCLDFTKDERGCNNFGNCVWKNRKGKTSCKQKAKKGNKDRRTRRRRERRARRRRRRN